jgi:predicted ATPase
LVQDAAHASLLRSTRQQLHAQIAAALETEYPELADSQPELLAQHYAEAGLAEKSVAYWGKAGRRSADRSAMAEAAAQFQKGLDQLALLPETAVHQRQVLELWSALGAALRFVKGLAAPETGHAYARARELWEQLGRPSEFLHVPYGQSRYHAARGELDLAQQAEEDLLRLSGERNETAGLILGHLSRGRTSWYTGNFSLAKSHLEEVLAIYDPISGRSIVDQTTIYAQVAAETYLGIVLLCLGFPDQAAARRSAAVAEARRLGHPPSLAVSLAVGARGLLIIEDLSALSEWADQLVSLTVEQGFSHWGAQGPIYQGWIDIQNGELAKGITLLRAGLAAFRATGAETLAPHFMTVLAQACGIGGRIKESLTLLDDAFQIVARTGEHWFTADLYRQKGQLMLRRENFQAAEELYCQALTIAQRQAAKLFELRAAVKLAQLRRDQGHRREAHDLLAPVYGWFTEGFNTQDLKSAKALLDQLN